MDLLLRIIDAGEVLVDVIPFAHLDLPDEYAAIRLHFSPTVLCIYVDPDDDSLHLSTSVPPETTPLPSLAGREPWNLAIGRPILWTWRLVNHQGYSDGLQFAFCDRERSRETVVIQVIGKASMIEVSVVNRCGGTTTSRG